MKKFSILLMTFVLFISCYNQSNTKDATYLKKDSTTSFSLEKKSLLDTISNNQSILPNDTIKKRGIISENAKNIQKKLPTNNTKNGEQYSLIENPSKTIKLKIDEVTTIATAYIQYDDKTNKLYMLSENTNILNVFNLNEKKIIKKIKFKNEGPNSVGLISGFYYKNKDTIFVFSLWQNRIYLCDENAKIKNKYDLPDWKDSHFPVSIVKRFNKLYYVNNKLYFSGDYAPILKEKNNINPLVEYDISTKKAIHIGEVPVRLGYKNWGNLTSTYIGFATPNSIVFGCNILDSLVIYNTRTKKINEFAVKSKFFTVKDIHPFSNSPNIKAKDYIERAKHQLSQPYYIGVLYDKYRKLYYVFVRYKSSYKNFISGKVQRTGIIILNNKFNKLGETIFTRVGMSNSFITKDGLYIINENAYNEIDDNYFQFDCFQLNKID